MKSILLVILSIAGTSVPCAAQWAVVDAANVQRNVMNYAALIEQLSRQATQINNQVRQIQQFETQLERLGDMSKVTSLVGFPEFRFDLSLPTKIETWTDGMIRIDGRGLFGDTRGGIHREITEVFRDFSGNEIERDATIYKEAHDLAVAVDEFKSVQSDVYTRREDLKRAIARTSEAMQAAETEAEQMKLEAVLNAQYSQLSAVDAEVALSAAEVQVKAAEATAMSNAQSEADAEARRRLAQQEAKKLSMTFKPKYECLLQYVTERRLAP